MSNIVFVKKVGSLWWLLKNWDTANSHICGNFSFKTKKEAVASGKNYGYIVLDKGETR